MWTGFVLNVVLQLRRTKIRSTAAANAESSSILLPPHVVPVILKGIDSKKTLTLKKN